MIHVTVVSPERVVFDGDADAVTVPAFDGQVGILSRHAPFVTLLGQGALRVRAGAAVHAFRIRGGFLQVIRNTLRVVTEQAEPMPAADETSHEGATHVA